MPTKQIELPVQGMTCASCVARIEKALSQQSGIREANVNFAAEKVRITFDPDRVQVPDFISTIQELGYQSPLEKIAIPIRGMSCASCVDKIERGLLEVPGVIHATVNLAAEKATVEYVAGQATLPDLRRAIEAVGYEALESAEPEGLVDREKEARAREIRLLGLKTLVGAILSVPLMRGASRSGSPGCPGS